MLRAALRRRSFDEATQATHEATRMAKEWREAAETANEKLRVALDGRKMDLEPQQASVAPANDEISHEFFDATSEETVSTLAAATLSGRPP